MSNDYWVFLDEAIKPLAEKRVGEELKTIPRSEFNIWTQMKSWAYGDPFGAKSQAHAYEYPYSAGSGEYVGVESGKTYIFDFEVHKDDSVTISRRSKKKYYMKPIYKRRSPTGSLSEVNCKHGVKMGRCDKCMYGDVPFMKHGH